MSLSNITNKAGLIPNYLLTTADLDGNLTSGNISSVVSNTTGITVAPVGGVGNVVLTSNGLPIAIAQYYSVASFPSSAPANNVEQVLQFDTIVSETAGQYSHTAVPFTVLNVTNTGNYKFNYCATFLASVAPAQVYLYLKIGGVVVSGSVVSATVRDTTNLVTVNGIWVQNITGGTSLPIQLCYKTSSNTPTGTAITALDALCPASTPSCSLIVQLLP